MWYIYVQCVCITFPWSSLSSLFFYISIVIFINQSYRTRWSNKFPPLSSKMFIKTYFYRDNISSGVALLVAYVFHSKCLFISSNQMIFFFEIRCLSSADRLSNRTGYSSSLTGNTCLYSQVSTFPLVQYLFVRSSRPWGPFRDTCNLCSSLVIYVLVQYYICLSLKIRILLRFTFLNVETSS